MKLLFIFLDGLGLGANDPATNPLAQAKMPFLVNLLEGRRLLAESAPYEPPHATLLSLDASLGVPGRPQSATGQATLLTGRNIPAALGYHYGPKPNPDVAAFVRNGNLFSTLQKAGKRAAFVNAYPPSYFAAIQSGRRLYSAIPLAATSAGLTLKTTADLITGQALAADITAHGWHKHLGIDSVPLLKPAHAGVQLNSLAQANDFTLFEYWLSDYAGHRQDMAGAIELLETLDHMIGGLVASWNNREGLILLTSDHGNIEDLGTRRHTSNPVPALMVGSSKERKRIITSMQNLADITPAILNLFCLS